MRVVALGNPEGARIDFVQQALAGLGRPPAKVLPWLAFLRDPSLLEAELAGEPSLLRIESCGQSWAVERELIGRALLQTGGNVTHAARLLKISRKGLQLKMKELELREERDG